VGCRQQSSHAAAVVGTNSVGDLFRPPWKDRG
jgi:hypothetical protein